MRIAFVILLIFYSLCLTYCNSHGTKETAPNLEKQSKSILLKFYPTGVIDDVRYSISVVGDSLIVKKSMSISDEVVYITLLTDRQTNKTSRLISAIKTQYLNTENFEDAWGVTLIINNCIVYEVGDFSFELPPNEVKNLIKYLVDLSAIKIALYGFP